jgi:hypothetical protein
MAKHVFEFDKLHLDRTDAVVLLAPAGKSGHLELGYTIGKGKPGFILYPEEPSERWEVMTQFATAVFFDRQKFLDHIKSLVEPLIEPDKAVGRSGSPNYLKCKHRNSIVHILVGGKRLLMCLRCSEQYQENESGYAVFLSILQGK